MQFFWDSLCEPYFFSEQLRTWIWTMGIQPSNFWAGEGGSVWLVAEKCTIWEQRWFSWTLSFLPKYLWPGLFLGQKFGIQSPMKGMIRRIQIPKKTNESLDELDELDESCDECLFQLLSIFSLMKSFCTVVQAGELPEVIKARESLKFDLPGWFF